MLYFVLAARNYTNNGEYLQVSSLISVKGFRDEVISTVNDKDTDRQRNFMDEKWVSSQIGITCETLTELN